MVLALVVWAAVQNERQEHDFLAIPSALLTDERINWNNEKAELYLVESASYGGNSGSPVFFFLGPERIPGQFNPGPLVKLAGVMQGRFEGPNGV